MPKYQKTIVPLKNYVIAFLLSLGAILLTLYIFSWYHLAQEKKYSESYLIKTNTIGLEVNDITEIESVFTEAPTEYFIYIGYRNDEDVYKLEKKLKKVIDKYNLNDTFYYIDVTELKAENNYIEQLNNALGLTDNKISNVPTILYVKNGKVLKDAIINREDGNQMEVGDFERLLEIYEIKK